MPEQNNAATDQISVSPVRSRNMAAIKGRNTTPELTVRKMLHRLGYRFRLHRRDLPGTPDIVLSKYRTVIFVHGCFWHRHPGCKFTTNPKTRREFWQSKFLRNAERDLLHLRNLRELRWTVVTIWECETRNPQALESELLKHFAYDPQSPLPSQHTGTTPSALKEIHINGVMTPIST
ncbi:MULTISPECIES: very short patch repair endonuclease [unclassified Synechococcus]|uniref:very short patch repair endonuclease n=1 Tax=unclassified Synechococcus TaxID=2626047 RepID=UPI00336BD557